jgi:hypothetical protein
MKSTRGLWRDTSSTTGSRPEESRTGSCDSDRVPINLNSTFPNETVETAVKKPWALLLLVFVSTALLATGYSVETTPFITNAIFSKHPGIDRTQNLSSQQGITGNVIIANVSPVCSVTGSIPSTGPDLVITSSSGRIQIVQLSWTLQNRCELVSPILVKLTPGTYSLSLSGCGYTGCRVLPITVTVVSGVFTPARINIVTGIY